MNQLSVFVLQSSCNELNQKTKNSLNLLTNHQMNIVIFWLDSIFSLQEYADKIDPNGISIILPAGDHLTLSYIDKCHEYYHLYQHFGLQPRFSYMFSRRGKVYYRRNIDLTPLSDETNALMLTPHASRHISFKTHYLLEFTATPTFSLLNNSNFIWGVTNFLLYQEVAIITLEDCITIEFCPSILQNKDDIYKGIYGTHTPLFEKDSLKVNQNFSDIYVGDKK